MSKSDQAIAAKLQAQADEIDRLQAEVERLRRAIREQIADFRESAAVAEKAGIADVFSHTIEGWIASADRLEAALAQEGAQDD